MSKQHNWMMMKVMKRCSQAVHSRS